jgi:hypothetical protein
MAAPHTEFLLNSEQHYFIKKESSLLQEATILKKQAVAASFISFREKFLLTQDWIQ